MIWQIFPVLLVQSPLLVVTLVGFIVSLARWRTAPVTSRWVLAASLLSLSDCFGAPVTQTLGPVFAHHYALPLSQIGIYYAVVGFVWATMRAAAVASLLVAAYVGRDASAPGGRETNLPPPPISQTGASQ